MRKLKVGAGKACVTPPREWFPFTNFTGIPMTDVKQDIYTRAVVLDNGETRFLFLSLESGASPDLQMKQDWEKEFGIPVENMVAVWTHNHSTELHWSREDGEQPHAKDYYPINFNAMRSAIRDAIDSLRPAKWGFGEGKSYINVNRDMPGEDGHWFQGNNFEGPSDKTLAVMKFVDEQGGLIAAVLNYACHATAAFSARDFDGNSKMTGGFPGYACAFLEKRYPGAVVVWNSGAAGDQNPILGPGCPLKYDDDGTAEMLEPPDGTRYIFQEYLGKTHAIDAIHVMDRIRELKDEMQIRSVRTMLALPGHEPENHIPRLLAFLLAEKGFRRTHPDMMIGDVPISQIDRVKMVSSGDSHMEMQLSLLGDVAWIGASGELFSEIGMKLKEASPFAKNVVVTHTEGDAMNNGGYIFSDAAADHDTFQRYHTETRPGGNEKRILDQLNVMVNALQSNEK